MIPESWRARLMLPVEGEPVVTLPTLDECPGCEQSTQDGRQITTGFTPGTVWHLDCLICF
jgi:hypothetical protein